MSNCQIELKTSFDMITSFSQTRNSDVTCIWLDFIFPLGARDQVKRIINNIRIFSTIGTCVKFIETAKDDTIIFITSASIGEKCIPIIHSLSQVDSIFLLCSSKNGRQMDWAKDFDKIQCMFTDIYSLCIELKKNTSGIKINTSLSTITSSPMHDNSFHLYRRRASINHQLEKKLNRSDTTLYLTSHLMTDDDTIRLDFVSNTTLDTQEARFMYTQLLKDILLLINDTNLEDMISHCRDLYAGNTAQLSLIDEFQRTYTEERAIYWYTRDSFLFKTLNNSLRIMDVDTIYAFRIVIRHIHKQLSTLAKESNYGEPLILFRGLHVSNSIFEQLKSNVGGLLSISHFLSTSSNYNVACMYAGEGSRQTTAILMIIIVDSSIQLNVPFANIEAQSNFEEGENEYLFSMGSVFRIVSVEYKEEKQFYEVVIALTADNDPRLTQLTNYNRHKIDQQPVLIMLAMLMYDIGKFDKSIQFYNMALNEEDAWANRSAILNNIGLNYDCMDEIDKALDYYQQSFLIDQAHLATDDPSLSTTIHNIGTVYYKKKNLDCAIEYFERAVQIDLASPSQNKENIARIYSNIGKVLGEQGKLTEKLKYARRALDMRLDILPQAHPDIAASYNNLASVLYQLDELEEALEYAMLAENIATRCHPSNHPDLKLYRRTASFMREKVYGFDYELSFTENH